MPLRLPSPRPVHPRRPLALGLASLVAAAGLVALAPSAANAAPADVRINEIESSGGTGVLDWVELSNPTTAAVDASGLRIKDSDDAHAFVVVPSGTTIPAGGTYAIDVDVAGGFGLGSADSVRLFAVDGTTVLDSYAWTAHAATTYGRCPDGTGAVTTTTVATRGAANDCGPAVRFNEVESNGDAVGDFAELVNVGTTAVDLSGWKYKDNDDAHAFAVIAAGTTIAPGGYVVLTEAFAGFGLGAADSVRLYSPAEQLVDSYSWTAHATTTYGRCPNGTGAFTTTGASTRGLANDCTTQPTTPTTPTTPTGATWPGGASVTTVDPANLVASNLSGLAYEGSGTSAPGTLWAVRNGAGTLFKLQRSGSTWGPAAGDWATGKALHYADGTGDPDAEGVTFTDAGSAGGMFVSTERNNSVSGTSRPAILRFDPSTAGTSLNATRDWNLTADLPGLGANLGLEGIAFVPDSSLTASGFRDQATGAAYDPKTYANHGTGLFFVGVEQNGMVYAYALDQTSNAYTRVASFASGFPSVMELSWEPETQQLWVVCDDTCQGTSSRFGVASSGAFTAQATYARPAGMPNLNNEGFTTAPRSECVDNLKPVFWADDGDTDGFSLRQGTLACTSPVTTAPGSTTPGATPATPTAPAVLDRVAPRVRLTGVKNGGFYPGKQPRPRCVGTDQGGPVSCTISRKKTTVAPSLVAVTVTAVATDSAGNRSRTTKTYLRRH